MKTLFKLIVFLALTISMGCGYSKQEDILSMDDTSAEVEKIKDHSKTWLKGAENGDVDAYFDAITDDFYIFWLEVNLSLTEIVCE
jgi:hypothetical protein